jgi:tetratricopeptide (TPR) repeat protein
MKLQLILPLTALLVGCSALPDRPGEKVDGAYAQARNQACLLVAQQCLEFGKYAEAGAAFQHWLGPIEDPVAHLTLARIHLGLGNRELAQEALAAAAALVPDSAPLRELLARFEPTLYPMPPSPADGIAALPASAPKGFVTLE